MLDERKLTKGTISEIETLIIDLNHAEMGAVILERWDLPASICVPIRYHHNPDNAPQEYLQATNILQIADRLSGIYNDPNSGKRVRQLHEELNDLFDLSEEQINELIDTVASHSIEILATFEIDPGDLKPYSQMLQEANEELGKLNLSYEQLIMELKEAKEETDRLAAEVHEANSKLRELVFREGLT